ncbi:EamA family transporter [Anaerolineales bacterium HSG24]|nr:EamA family transporter [Anaerolineales bacterium HSG24]
MQPNQLQPTLIGASTILIWSTLALFTALSGTVPPFQLTAMSFTIAFLIGVIFWLIRGEGILRHLKQPKIVWLIGVGGLFGFHFFYFLALQNAPTVEASLISYLWPLLIVLFSAMLPGERLRWFHVVGAGMGFIGAALLVTKGQRFSFEVQYSWGYLAALMAALTWSSYSVLSRLFGSVPTDSVGGFCGVTAILAFGCHFLFEETVWPMATEWLAVLALGLGPVGLAFFTWDYGIKHGDIKLLGALAYFAPLLSTILLVLFGLTEASWLLSIACLLIVGGAMLAAWDLMA